MGDVVTFPIPLGYCVLDVCPHCGRDVAFDRRLPDHMSAVTVCPFCGHLFVTTAQEGTDARRCARFDREWFDREVPPENRPAIRELQERTLFDLGLWG